MNLPPLDKDTKARIASEIGFQRGHGHRVFIHTWQGTAILLVVQHSKPGSALYDVKKGTTKVRNLVTDKLPFVDHNETEDESRHESNHHEDRSGSSSASTPSLDNGISHENKVEFEMHNTSHTGKQSEDTIPSGSDTTTEQTVTPTKHDDGRTSDDSGSSRRGGNSGQSGIDDKVKP